MFGELRRATRSLLRSPAFTVTVVLVLGLTIGAQTTVLALVDQLVVNPLPYDDSDELVTLRFEIPNGPGVARFSEGLYLLAGDEETSLQALSIVRPVSQTLELPDRAERVAVSLVSSDVHDVYRIGPVVGRRLDMRDMEPGAAPVAVLTEGAWRRLYGGDPSVVGRSLILDGRSREIVGVVPSAGTFPISGSDLWVPVTIDRADPDIQLFLFEAVGRRDAGADLDVVVSDMERLIKLTPEVYPSMLPPQAVSSVLPRVETLENRVAAPVRFGVSALLASASVLLIVAVVNVLGLQFARARSRSTEYQVRAALGAGTSHLRASQAAEPIVLSVLGGVLGFGLAALGLSFMSTSGSALLPDFTTVGFDVVTGLWGVAVTGLTAILLVIGSLLGAAGTARGRTMERRTGPRLGRRTQLLFTGGQVVAATLLVGTSLVVLSSLRTVGTTGPGFDTDGLFGARLNLPAAEYSNWDDVRIFQRELLRRVREQRGVGSAGLTSFLPQRDGRIFHGWFPPSDPPGPDELPDTHLTKAISDGYLETMGLRILAGRSYTSLDFEPGAPPVVVVNERAAREFWPGENVIGQTLQRGPDGPVHEVVGVVDNVRDRDPFAPAPPIVYVPFSDRTMSGGLDARQFSIAIRSSGAPASLASLTEAVRGVDPSVPVYAPEPMAQTISRGWARVALIGTLITIAAGTTVVLAGVGLFGTVAYTVSTRRREIGVRLALGAGRGAVVGYFTRDVIVTGALGIGIGIVATTSAHPFMTTFAPDGAVEPIHFTLMTALILAVVAIAAAVPVARATREGVLRSVIEDG